MGSAKALGWELSKKAGRDGVKWVKWRETGD